MNKMNNIIMNNRPMNNNMNVNNMNNNKIFRLFSILEKRKIKFL